MPLALLQPTKRPVSSTALLRSLQQVKPTAAVVKRPTAPKAVATKAFALPHQLVPVGSPIMARPAKILPPDLQLPTAPPMPPPLVNLSISQPPNPLVVDTPAIFNPPVSTGKTGVGFIDKVLEAGEKVAVEIDKIPGTIQQIKEGVKALPGEAAQAREDLSRAAQLQQMLPWAVVIIVAVILLKR